MARPAQDVAVQAGPARPPVRDAPVRHTARVAAYLGEGAVRLVLHAPKAVAVLLAAGGVYPGAAAALGASGVPVGSHAQALAASVHPDLVAGDVVAAVGGADSSWRDIKLSICFRMLGRFGSSVRLVAGRSS